MKFNKTVLAVYLRFTIYMFLVLMTLTYLFAFYRLTLAELIVLTIIMICFYICTGINQDFKKLYHLVLTVLSFVLMINGLIHNKLIEIVSFVVFAIYNAIMLYILTKK